jgi:hypothetical protein
MTSSSPTRWIDTETAAKLLGISGRWLRQLLDEGLLPDGVCRRLPIPRSTLHWNREVLLAWAAGTASRDL